MSFNYILNKKNTVKASLQMHFYENRVKIIWGVVLTAVIFAFALILGIKSGERLLFLLSAFCFVRVISLFYLPYSNAKISAQAFSEDKEFNFELMENGVAITPRDSERKEILFDEKIKAFETKDFFIIISKERFFPIPKEFMEKEAISQLSDVFSKTFSNKK